MGSQSRQSEQNISEPGVVEKKVGVPFILTSLTPDEHNLQALKRPNPVSEWLYHDFPRGVFGGSAGGRLRQVSLYGRRKPAHLTNILYIIFKKSNKNTTKM